MQKAALANRALQYAPLGPAKLLPPHTLRDLLPDREIHHVQLRAPLGDAELADLQAALGCQTSLRAEAGGVVILDDRERAR